MPVAAFTLFVVGFTVTSAGVGAVPAADRFAKAQTRFDIWVWLVSSVTGFALAAGPCFVVWASHLLRLVVLRRRYLLGWAVVCAVVPIGLVFVGLTVNRVSAPDSLDKQLADQTFWVTVVAGLCVFPGLVAFVVVRLVALREDPWAGDDLDQVRLVLRIRRELRRLLVCFGAFLTLIVVTTGMRRRALNAAVEGLDLPPEIVLLYGLVFAVLLGGYYAAAEAGITRRADRIVDAIAPLVDPRSEGFSDALRRRTDLSALVGGGGTRRSFESAVVVAAPLLTALIGSAIGN